MYDLDGSDSVVELDVLPGMETGAPAPIVKLDSSADKYQLSYYARGDKRVTIEFDQFRAAYFGPPNDEALTGHPLYARGLRWYDMCEVKESSWIRRLAKMNSVHPRHNPSRYDSLHHYIFAFHDQMFECIAEGFNIVSVQESPPF